VVAVFRDDGISGTKGRQQRPGLDALLRGVARQEFDIVAAWSVCRLGRSPCPLGCRQIDNMVRVVGTFEVFGISRASLVQAALGGIDW
jgi:DNA invertase Pin-like site-specific DNA recombinase